MTDVDVELGNLGVGRPGLGAGSSESNPEQAEVRNSRALELRLAGRTFAQIGAALNISTSTAYEAVQSALRVDRERTAALRDEYRALHLERCERIIMANWNRGVLGEMRAVRVLQLPPVDEPDADPVYRTEQVRVIDGPSANRIFRALEREAKLLGLDAPMRVSVTDETREQVEGLITELETMLRAEAGT